MRYLKYLLSVGFLVFGCWSIRECIVYISTTIPFLPMAIEVYPDVPEEMRFTYIIGIIECIQIIPRLLAGIFAVIISLKQCSWVFIRNTGIIKACGYVITFIGLFGLSSYMPIGDIILTILKYLITPVFIIIIAFLVKRWGNKIYSPIPVNKMFRAIIQKIKDNKIKW